jgi:hypothetical protein
LFLRFFFLVFRPPQKRLGRSTLLNILNVVVYPGPRSGSNSRSSRFDRSVSSWPPSVCVCVWGGVSQIDKQKEKKRKKDDGAK